jgi:hypothetical protein
MTHRPSDSGAREHDLDLPEDVLVMAERLERERPLPSAGFRGELRRHLLLPGGTSPRRIRTLIAAYAGSGLAMLALAAVGLAGAGPLAAG